MVKMTKTAITISVMNANAEKPMEDVVKLIAEANAVSEAVARGAYRWCVNKGVASGVLQGKASKAVTVAKPKAVKTVKLSKIVAATNKAFTAKANKSMLDVLAAEKAAGAPAKAANLARLKEVSAKRKTYTNVARPEGEGIADFDSVEAKHMVNSYMAGNDSAIDDAPRFLTKSELAVIL